jgi:hypothetical protein
MPSARVGQVITGRRGWPALLLGVLVAACQDLQPAEQATVDAWLVCTECIDHELDSLLALAQRKRVATVTALRDGLLAGPTAAQRQNFERQLDSTYKTLDSLRVGQPIVPRSQFVRRYLENFLGTYRIRSAIALAKLKGPDVKPALDSAAANQLRTPGDSLRPTDSVAVAFARDSIWQPQ